MRRKAYFCVLLFLIGIAVVSVFCGTDANVFGNEYHMQNFGTAELNRMGLLCRILWKRGNLFLMLAVLFATPVRKWIPFCTMAAFSFLAGIYIRICTIWFSGRGGLVFLISLFPHGVFYGMVIGGLFLMRKTGAYYRKKEALPGMLAALVMLTLFFTGALLEVWASSSVLQSLFFPVA